MQHYQYINKKVQDVENIPAFSLHFIGKNIELFFYYSYNKFL